jgi:hypothetical protein
MKDTDEVVESEKISDLTAESNETEQEIEENINN